ncbi:MAG TPA: tetratricopeptide repeat protein [Verrucomicrobiae bacterium]|jgi:tetratricopeptide (TPR) repeat protein
MALEQPARTRRAWLPALVLAAAVVLAYQPAWHAGFVWDDDVYVTHNSLLTAPDGLKRIWFSTDSPSQYFPLAYTVLRAEHGLWGLAGSGYHWVNIILHAANALLLWGLLRRLRWPAAWLAAALFALHPVQVESVAWVTELKNVLSLFCCLLAAWAWVEFAEDRPGAWRYYCAALALQAAALFAKTTACAWPVALLLILWMTGKPINARRIAQIVPFFLLGLAMGLVSMWWEQHHQYAVGGAFAISWTGRVLIASRALWFYLGKLAWPAGLSFSYAHWHINPADPLQYAWLAACLLAAVAIWFSGRAVKASALFYVAMLAPLLGFITEYTFRYTFVADHYQYAACIGPLILAAAAADKWLARFGQAKAVICACVLVLLGGLTWRQCQNYADSETLWRATLASVPSTIARNNLAHALLDKRQWDEAISLSREVLAGDPADPVALNNLGFALLEKGGVEESISFFQRAMAAQPNDPDIYYNLGRARLKQARYDSAATNFQSAVRLRPDFADAYCNLGYALLQAGRAPAAISNYQKAIELAPDYALAHNDLGSILLRMGDTNQARQHFERAAAAAPDFAEAHYNLGGVLFAGGQLDEALSQYEEVARLQPKLAGAHFMLGRIAAAYAAAGRPDRAAPVAARALELARSAGETALAEKLAAQLQAYQSAARK